MGDKKKTVHDPIKDVKRSYSPIQFRLNCGVLYKKQFWHDVVIKPLSGYVRKKCAGANLRKNGAKLTTVMLANLIEEVPGLDLRKESEKEKFVRAMLGSDRQDLVIVANKMSHGKMLNVVSQCTNSQCGANNRYEVDIDEEFKFIPWPEEYNSDGNIYKGHRVYRIDSEADDYYDEEWEPITAAFKFPNGTIAETVWPLLGENPVDAAHKTLAMCMVEFDGGPPLSQTQIEDMPTWMIDWINEQCGQHQYGKITSFQGECSRCGSLSHNSVDMTSFLFKTSRSRPA